jgi:hypothetical protein
MRLGVMALVIAAGVLPGTASVAGPARIPVVLDTGHR